MTEETRKDVKETVALMQELINDRSVPRNIRTIVEDAAQKLQAKTLDAANLGNAIYLLDDISNDINMPSHTRTDIWQIISKLEALKEKVK
ncbi:MAG: UPF0147 family protein [Candidatus ainarchaeum sp.]|nr:UPF0147 family protein [Candidatus ainarchaeum sp.]